jgi:hypothetical protein
MFHKRNANKMKKNQAENVNESEQSKPKQEYPNGHVKYLYEKIESIKGAISMANGDRPELWIQRQNLQDLYHQIILRYF